MAAADEAWPDGPGSYPGGGPGNGRRAASYVALVDLDPQLAELLLETLGEAGVAAYAVPTTGRRTGALVAPRIDRPLHRVYVDAAAVGPARRLAEQQLPRLQAEHGQAGSGQAASVQAASGQAGNSQRPGSDEDAWAQIVAAYDEPAAEPVRRWRAEDDPPPGNRADGEPRSAPVPPPPSPPPSLPPTQPPTQRTPADEEHFVPPPPPPLPRTDPLTKLGWVGLLGAPVFLVVGVLLGLPLDGWLGLCGIAGFLGGFVVLVLRMQDRPPRDIDPDDGAVV